MSSPERLLQATLNRLGIRISKKILSYFAELAIIAKDAPEKIQTEWDLFQEEVIEEANRLEKKSVEDESIKEKAPKNAPIESPQERINEIRAKVAALNSKLEAQS